MTDTKPLFDEQLCVIHDKLAFDIQQHFSAGEPTKESALNIALQYMNSGMLHTAQYLKQELEQSRAKVEKLREALRLVVLKEPHMFMMIECSEAEEIMKDIKRALKETEGSDE